MKKVTAVVVAALLVAFITGCSTTQKTVGGGLTSAVAQNVVRIACVESLRDVDLTAASGKAVEIKLTGFSDDKNSGILEHLFKTKAEEAGARIVPEGKGDVQLEVATMNAGNDAGQSSFPIISHSERVEGAVDVQMTIRKLDDGAVLTTQPLSGKAKYEQTTVIGIQGRGQYYVKNKDGKFVKVADPSSYR